MHTETIFEQPVTCEATGFICDNEWINLDGDGETRWSDGRKS